METVIPLICTLLIVASAVFVIIGWILIVKGKRIAHERMMVSAAILAILFLILYLTRTAIFGNTVFAGPDSVKLYYTIFLIFHIILSIFGAILGFITIRHAYKARFVKHRKLGPITALVWILTAITGVIVYYLLYVRYAGVVDGEVGNLWEAIFGK